MTININSILTIGKSLNIKREKGDDDSEQTFAHLKFTDLFLKREQVNQVCNQRDGWAETSLFDEMGAPLGRWTLTLHEAAFTVAAVVSGPSGKGIKITSGLLDGIDITPTKLGAVMAGEIAWPIAGDEAGDVEPLLGRECTVTAVLTDGEQMDMLKDVA